MGDEAGEWTIGVTFAYRQQAETAAERLAAKGFAATADGSVLTIAGLTEAQSDALFRGLR